MRYTLFFPCSLFSLPCFLFPKTSNSVPHQIEKRYKLLQGLAP
ncbi:hypothetical protein [Moorena sp. SIO1F2]|nr:hypothetical protein [Moorena sp. SIO1F2]